MKNANVRTKLPTPVMIMRNFEHLVDHSATTSLGFQWAQCLTRNYTTMRAYAVSSLCPVYFGSTVALRAEQVNRTAPARQGRSQKFGLEAHNVGQHGRSQKADIHCNVAVAVMSPGC